MSAEIAIPPLAPDEVHVWTVVTTDVSAADVEPLTAVLSPHEQHRAGRLRQPEERAAFIVGRARTRQILAAYVGQPGHLLDIVTRVNDKPTLAGAPPWFDFSFSRCAHVHVCAVGVGRRIGIDVELVDAHEPEGIARAYFSDDERRWLTTRAEPERPAAFASVWTKKEAVVKAAGAGFVQPLTTFSVPMDGDGQLAGGPPGYTVRSFTPARGLAGAVAAEGDWRLTTLRHPG